LVEIILKNIVAGFGGLHQHKIIHRDLKLENIMVKFPSNGGLSE